MPRPKKNKRGGGRPKAAAEDLTYSNKSTPEKREYHNQAQNKAEHRIKKGIDEQDLDVVPNESPSFVLPRGRPSIADDPMTPRTHQKRSTERRSLKRKATQISKFRSKIAIDRW